MQTLQRGTGIDTQIVSEHSLEPAVGVQCVVLAFRQIVGGDQLRPQRFSVRVLAHQDFELTDYRMHSAASYFDFCSRSDCHELVLCQCRREGVHEFEVTQILEHRPAPLG